MINLRNLIFVVLWSILVCIIYYNFETRIQKHGHEYNRYIMPNGNDTLVHSDSCKCTGQFGKQFEFMN
jgi:hypothetical protein